MIIPLLLSLWLGGYHERDHTVRLEDRDIQWSPLSRTDPGPTNNALTPSKRVPCDQSSLILHMATLGTRPLDHGALKDILKPSPSKPALAILCILYSLLISNSYTMHTIQSSYHAEDGPVYRTEKWALKKQEATRPPSCSSLSKIHSLPINGINPHRGKDIMLL